MSNINPKDSVFADATEEVSDFETIFDYEDSIIEAVMGFDEDGNSLIGRDPEEEFTTDSDGKNTIEGSGNDDIEVEKDAETAGGIKDAAVKESADLDDLLLEEETAESFLEDGQTDITDDDDILAEVDDDDWDDFHDEAASAWLEGGLCPKCGEAICTCGLGLKGKIGIHEPGKEGEVTGNTDNKTKNIEDESDDKEIKDFHDEAVAYLESDLEGESEHEDIIDNFEGAEKESELLKSAKESFSWFDESDEQTDNVTKNVEDEVQKVEFNDFDDTKAETYLESDAEAEYHDYAEDELIAAADEKDGDSNMNLDYQAGEDDIIIDDVIGGKE